MDRNLDIIESVIDEPHDLVVTAVLDAMVVMHGMRLTLLMVTGGSEREIAVGRRFAERCAEISKGIKAGRIVVAETG